MDYNYHFSIDLAPPEFRLVLNLSKNDRYQLSVVIKPYLILSSLQLYHFVCQISKKKIVNDFVFIFETEIISLHAQRMQNILIYTLLILYIYVHIIYTLYTAEYTFYYEM